MLQFVKSLVPAPLRKNIKLLVHSGSQVECPFCGYEGKDLAPIGYDFPVLREKQIVGGGYRKACCHKCFCSDRERLLYTYLFDASSVLEQAESLRVLHVAPEPSLSEELLKLNFKEYVCGDLFTEGYSYPDHVINLNVTDIPFEDEKFDLVICNHVLEHVPDDIAAMKELYRVLKTGGRAILQVPISNNTEETFEDFSVTDPKEREVVFGQFDHLRIYGQDYTKRLESVGFTTERLNISDEYPKRGLNPQEDIFIAYKKPIK